MQPFLKHADLCVKKSVIHGYGVFTQQDIAEGEIIEEAYSLIVTSPTGGLHNYYFTSEDALEFILPLGFGSIYNHADECNALHDYNQTNKVMRIWAKRPIRSGEEIFISYGKQWFDKRMVKPKTIPLYYKIRQRLCLYRSPIRFGLLVLFCYLSLQMISFPFQVT